MALVLAAVDQYFGSAFEKDFDLGSVFDGRSDAEPEAGVLHNIAGCVAIFGRIALCNGHVLSLQKGLIAARADAGSWRSGCTRFTLANLPGRCTRFVRFVAVLRIARVAVYARGLDADHGFNGM